MFTFTQVFSMKKSTTFIKARSKIGNVWINTNNIAYIKESPDEGELIICFLSNGNTHNLTVTDYFSELENHLFRNCQ
jgi:hypothetical protein